MVFAEIEDVAFTLPIIKARAIDAMTRTPSGISFAQYFPTAPKVKADHQGRADQERVKTLKGLDSNTSTTTLLPPDADATVHQHHNHISSQESAPLPPHLEDRESSVGDIPSTGGSLVSHASSATSVLSNVAYHVSAPISSRRPDPTSLHRSDKDCLTPSSYNGSTNGIASGTSTYKPSSKSHSATFVSRNDRIQTLDDHLFTSRIMARDPTQSVKGRKCIFDPLLDRTRNKPNIKGTKPKYQEFGLVRAVQNHTHPAC